MFIIIHRSQQVADFVYFSQKKSQNRNTTSDYL